MRTVAEAIWSAAISAVLPERLVARRVSLDDLSLAAVDRIAVVGAGKAAGGMAAGIAELLGAEGLARHRVSGLVSVPAGCGRSVVAVKLLLVRARWR